MGSSGFTFVGTVTGVAQVEGRDGTKYPGFWNVEMLGADGSTLKATANSHKKQEDGGELHAWWPVLAGNVGTGVVVEVKGFSSGGGEVDEWGNAKKPKLRINGAKLAAGGAPQGQTGGQQQPVQAPQQGPTGGQQQAAPPAQQQTVAAPASTPATNPAGWTVQDCIQAVAAVLHPLEEYTDDWDELPPRVRGAMIRHQAAKVLSLSHLLWSKGPGPTPEEERAAAAYPGSEEPSAPQASTEEPGAQQLPSSDWGQPQPTGASGWGP